MRNRLSMFRLALLWSVALLTAACGGSGSNPMAPSAPPGASASPGATSGATISGTVTGTSASSGIRALAGPMTVSVTGTSLTSAVDDAGGFELKGVPEGPVELRFASGTDDARLGLGEVKRDDSIRLAVSVSGSIAIVLSMSRDGSSEVELKGRIDAVDAASQSLRVLDRRILVTAATEILEGTQARRFDSLKVGQTVEIKGTSQGDLVSAVRITIEDQDAGREPLPPVDAGAEVQLRGAVAGLSGACPVLQFSVGGTRVQTTGATAFERLACSDVRGGVLVEVEGRRDGNGVVVARTLKGEDAPGAPDAEVEFLGTLSAMSGSSPNLTLTVGGRTVRTSVATVVRRSSNEVGLAALVVGQSLQVKGLARADGSVEASRLTIEDEAPAVEIEFEGTLTSMAGSAPSLTLTVGGRSVTTSAETVVRRSGDVLGFGALAVGQRLQVVGRAQGSAVAATRLTIED